jgi:UDP-glucose 4-epimerase
VLITGGAGFIGSHLCDSILRGNIHVTVVDNLLLGKESNITHLFDHSNFKYYKKDVLDYESMSGIFKAGGFDEVFHFAANSDITKSVEDPNIDLSNTFMTTFNILSLMKRYGVKRIVFASTSAIYGETRHKIKENCRPQFPLSHYGAGKLASEAFISSFIENYDMQAWICRFPNVVGGRATHGILYDFVNKLNGNPNELEVLGDGEQYKPYIYVKDLVEAIIFIRNNTNEKINSFNIGVNSRTKVKDIARIVLSEMGLSARIRYTGGNKGWIGDVKEYDYDLAKISKLGWEARYTSDEAVQLAIRDLTKK